MPDGDLKTKAFEMILTHLLSGAGITGMKSERVVKAKRGGTEKVKAGQSRMSVGARLLSLKADAFFSAQRSIEEIRQELKKNGWHYPVTSLSGPLQTLVQKRELHRERISNGSGKKGWRYSNP